MKDLEMDSGWGLRDLKSGIWYCQVYAIEESPTKEMDVDECYMKVSQVKLNHV